MAWRLFDVLAFQKASEIIGGAGLRRLICRVRIAGAGKGFVDDLFAAGGDSSVRQDSCRVHRAKSAALQGRGRDRSGPSFMTVSSFLRDIFRLCNRLGVVWSFDFELATRSFSPRS